MIALPCKAILSVLALRKTEHFHFIRGETIVFLLIGALGIGPLFQVSL